MAWQGFQDDSDRGELADGFARNAVLCIADRGTAAVTNKDIRHFFLVGGCDGAKPGCSMKIVTGADSAMRSAFMALAGYGISSDEGVLGRSAEESIQNLSKISLVGMGLVDPTVVHILKGKCPRRGKA